MAESDLIQVTTSLSAAQVSVAGFGKPIILANGDNTASWGSSLYREYSSLAGVAADFAKTTGTYLQAAAVFAQTPTVPLLGIGLRATSNTTQTFFMDVTAAAQLAGAIGLVLNWTVNGNAATYTIVTGDTGGTTTEHDLFITHLVSAITGAAWYGASGITATSDTTGGAGAHLVKLVCTAGTINDVVVTQTTLNSLILYQSQGVAGSGGSSTQVLLANDLTNIAAQNNTWYAILSPFTSAIEIMAIAKYAQANTKIAIVQSSDTNNVTVSASSDATLAAATPAPTDPPVTATAASIMALLQNAAYTRTMIVYTQTLLNFTDGAWAGDKLWTLPGSEMWAYATLSGVAAVVLTETQRNNVVGTLGAPTGGKNGNVYETVGGIAITELGITSGGQFIDVIRFLDWVNANIQAAILQAFANASAAGSKIPFTQAGITMVCGLVLGVLKQGVTNGGFAGIPLPTVNVPAIGSISLSNLTARNLPSIAWAATLSGAVQTATVAGNVVA